MILNPLTPIQVLDSPIKCIPGSLGYLINQQGYYAYNVWSYAILFYRIGKSGKDRLEIITAKSTMIDYKEAGFTRGGINIIKNVELAEGIYPRLLYSDIGRRRPRSSHYADHTQFEPLNHRYKNALDMPVWNFIAYISAMSAFLDVISRNLYEDTYTISERPTPKISSAEFGEFPYSMPHNRRKIWIMFMSGLKRDKRNKDEVYESTYREFFELEANRAHYLTGLNKDLSIAFKNIRHYHKSIKLHREFRLQNIVELIRYYKKNKMDYQEMAKRSKTMKYSGPLPEERATLKEAG